MQVLKSMLIALIITGVAFSQEVLQPWTFSALTLAAASLTLGDNRSSAELQKARDVQDLLKALRSRYIQKYRESGDTPTQIKINFADKKGFSDSMSDTLWSLQHLPTDATTRLSILTDIKEDLRLKLAFVSSAGYGAGGLFPSIIMVTVATVDSNGAEVKGLWVRCNPRRYGVTGNPLFIFNSATSPTKAALPPGGLICWVQSSLGSVLLKQPIELGSDGQVATNITLSLP